MTSQELQRSSEKGDNLLLTSAYVLPCYQIGHTHSPPIWYLDFIFEKEFVTNTEEQTDSENAFLIEI